MAVNNFLEFNEQKNEMQTDEQYSADTQRIGGLQTGLARTVLHNKLFRQASVMVSALGKVVADLGKNADDTSRDALAQNIKDTMLSAENHALSTETQALYGVENVDAAFLDLITSRFLAFYGFSRMVQNNSLGDATFSSNGSFHDARMIVYDNLTINAGVTVTPSRAKNQIIFVKDTLTLNGTISVKDKGGAGGQSVYDVNNPGAKGAGAILVFASRVVGTGTIQASGTDAANATGTPPTSYADGFNGVAGFMFNSVVAAGARATYGGPGAGGGSSVNAKLPSGGFYLSQVSMEDFGAGGGGSGSYSNSSSYQGAGGGGGGGAFGAGGNGGATPKGSGVGGGGGGGGGLIILVSSFGVPGISLIAKGGKGGNGSSTAGGGGGGGGGGQVIIIAPSSTAIVDVSGGVGGSPTGTASAGAVGVAGLSMLL